MVTSPSQANCGELTKSRTAARDQNTLLGHRPLRYETVVVADYVIRARLNQSWSADPPSPQHGSCPQPQPRTLGHASARTRVHVRCPLEVDWSWEHTPERRSLPSR